MESFGSIFLRLAKAGEIENSMDPGMQKAQAEQLRIWIDQESKSNLTTAMAEGLIELLEAGHITRYPASIFKGLIEKVGSRDMDGIDAKAALQDARSYRDVIVAFNKIEEQM